jgi:hypothetical protein
VGVGGGSHRQSDGQRSQANGDPGAAHLAG